MAAPKVDIERTDDGGVSLVATVDGVALTFAHVNPSQFEEARVAQGVAPAESDEPEQAEAKG